MTVATLSTGDLRIVYRAGGTGLGFLGFFSSLRWRSRLPMVIPLGWCCYCGNVESTGSRYSGPQIASLVFGTEPVVCS